MAVVSYPHTSTAYMDTGVVVGPGYSPYTSATFAAGADKAIVLSTGVSVPAGEISVTVTLNTLTAQAGIAPRSPSTSSPNLAPLDTGGLASFTAGGRSYLRLDSSKPTATTSWAHPGGVVLLTLLMTSPSGGSLTFTPITQNLSPVLGMICPSTGSAAGGTVVSFAGARLGQITSVTFDGTPGTGLTVTPGIGGTVTSPAHIAGAVDMVAQSANGPSAPVTFTYAAPPVTPPPTITKLIPTSGPDTGGTLVDIIGANLTGATGVDFGGVPGTGLVVDPFGGLATVTSPAHTAGPAPVTITTPAGTSAAETFTFEAPLPPGPVVVAVIPGAALPGATVQLVGTNLTDATVTMCGETVAIVSNDGNIITVVVPPGCPDGDTTITVTTPDGETTAGLTVLPASGPTDGPDVIANLVALLASELGVPVSSRRSPTATKDSDPSVVVRRTGGPSKGVASDNPTVTIEAWAPTTTESFQLLQSARLVVIEAAEQGRAGLRRYDEFAGPADLPDPSTTNPRHTLTASVVTRLE